MTTRIVKEVVLRADTLNGDNIIVTLYKGEQLTGNCDTEAYPYGYNTAHILSCDRVEANLVELKVIGDLTDMSVYEIKVTSNDGGMFVEIESRLYYDV